MECRRVDQAQRRDSSKIGGGCKRATYVDGPRCGSDRTLLREHDIRLGARSMVWRLDSIQLLTWGQTSRPFSLHLSHPGCISRGDLSFYVYPHQSEPRLKNK